MVNIILPGVVIVGMFSMLLFGSMDEEKRSTGWAFLGFVSTSMSVLYVWFIVSFWQYNIPVFCSQDLEITLQVKICPLLLIFGYILCFYPVVCFASAGRGGFRGLVDIGPRRREKMGILVFGYVGFLIGVLMGTAMALILVFIGMPFFAGVTASLSVILPACWVIAVVSGLRAEDYFKK